MIEANKGTSLVIIILSVIVLLIISLFVYWEFFSSAGENDNINFFKEGNIIINNPGFIKDIWYLSYETKNSSINTAKLFFNKDSVCKNKTDSCLDLAAGESVEVKGVEKNGDVLVKELKLIEILN
ncbi:MAG TPA: hypothetical protein PLD14_01920 [Candidatus Pacearchaeota archaeon]|nr:hypothetical protein [Candidatus Pacearchaeota archaeon]HPR79957.1 hypothetical protein [Candidatus Pacearchaeota archaeon]